VATFADFVLLRAVAGSAGVMRARRVHPAGEGPAVHLARVGRGDDVLQRLTVVADAAQSSHEQVARIHEVGRFEGEGYAVADALDGVELAAILEHDHSNKIAPEVGFSLAVALQLAQLALDLNERGDVWAADSGVSLSTLFPAGLSLEGVALRSDGSVFVRVLAGAGRDVARPTPFRAPELRVRRPSASSDVFLVTQLLRALLSGDPSATMAPRLAPAASNLGGLLAGGLSVNPDERLGLFMLVEQLVAALAAVVGKHGATSVVAASLKREYRSLATASAPDVPMGTIAETLRARLGDVRAAMDVVWPKRSPSERGSLLADDPMATAVHSYHRAPVAVAPVPPAGISGAGRTMNDELTAQTRALLRGSELTSLSESDKSAIGSTVPPHTATKEVPAPAEASSAPPVEVSDIEGGPTEVRATFDDNGVRVDDTKSPPTLPPARGTRRQR
jgi:hypothetical protein